MSDPGLSTGISISLDFVYFTLHFRINKQPKFGQLYGAAEIKWSVRLDKNQFFYFHPSKRDCSRLKSSCQRLADTGQPSKEPRFVYWHIALVLARPFQPKTILFRRMEIETTELLFVQSMLNRSSDLSGRIKLVKLKLFIDSKLEPKINKIYRNIYIGGKPGFWELTRHFYFRNTANVSESMSWFSDMYFSLILVNVSYFLYLGEINSDINNTTSNVRLLWKDSIT